MLYNLTLWSKHTRRRKGPINYYGAKTSANSAMRQYSPYFICLK